MSVMEGERSSWEKNADSANPKLCGEGAGVDESFGEKRPSVFHFFCTNKILMLKF